MDKFFVENGKIYYEDKQNGAISLDTVCNILNILEEYEKIKPKDCIDFNKYVCENCGKEEFGHSGSWSQDPYLFFCSKRCQMLKQEQEDADNNKLDYCPVCQKNKMVYVGRADSYWCYGCEQWYNYDEMLRQPW